MTIPNCIFWSGTHQNYVDKFYVPDDASVPGVPDDACVPGVPDDACVPGVPDDAGVPGVPDDAGLQLHTFSTFYLQWSKDPPLRKFGHHCHQKWSESWPPKGVPNKYENYKIVGLIRRSM